MSTIRTFKQSYYALYKIYIISKKGIRIMRSVFMTFTVKKFYIKFLNSNFRHTLMLNRCMFNKYA